MDRKYTYIIQTVSPNYISEILQWAIIMQLLSFRFTWVENFYILISAHVKTISKLTENGALSIHNNSVPSGIFTSDSSNFKQI